MFAHGLYLPTGFELGDGGVFAIDQPNLVFLKDTDGVADVKEIVLQGFGTEDSHHVAGTFEWAPGGGLLTGEGVFLHTQIETPTGTVRLKDAGFLRYDPKDGSVLPYVNGPFLNPWGQVFDRFGDYYIGDASDGKNVFATPMTGRIDWPAKHRMIRDFTSRVRPTAGVEIVSSRQFPDDVQGDLLVANCIGFRGIKHHRIVHEGAGVRSEELPDLLSSSDPNFRPVDLRFGPDGALYFVDWFNPLIGHMQYSLFDERRDHSHGRIWRVVADGRPLVTPPRIDGASEDELLELLRQPENRTRYRVRRELRSRPRDRVAAAIDTALGRPHAADDEQWSLEVLWTCQGWHLVRQDLLQRLLEAREPRVRAAAVEVLCAWRDRLPDALDLLRARADDEHPRVRLAVVVAASRFGSAPAAEIALHASEGIATGDAAVAYALEETLFQLRPWYLAALRAGRAFCARDEDALARALGTALPRELLALPRSPSVLRAILGRADVDLDARRAALTELARDGEVDAVDEALALIETAQQRSESPNDEALAPLLAMLAGAPPESLAAQIERLEALTRSSALPTARAGFAASMRAGRSAAELWPGAHTEVARMALLEAVSADPDRAGHELVPTLRDLVYASDDVLAPPTPPARFVRITIPGDHKILHLAEVAVLTANGENVARDGEARQSSLDFGGLPERAIDGRTDGRYGAGSMSHTQVERDPWWEVKLAAPTDVATVRVWNRTEPPWDRRLEGFKIQLLDDHRNVVWERTGLRAPAPDLAIATGRNAGDPDALRAAALHALVATSPDPELVVPELTAMPSPWGEATLDAALAAGAMLRTPSGRSEDLASWLATVLTDTPRARRGRPFYWRALLLAEATLGGLPADARATLEAATHEARQHVPSPAELDAGRQVFATICAACHQPDGRGLTGAFPPLLGSPWLAREPDVLARIVLHGLAGGIEVGGKRFDAAMAPLGPVLDDAQIAAALSFVRTEFGGLPERVTPELVRDVRSRHADRTEPWHPDELER